MQPWEPPSRYLSPPKYGCHGASWNPIPPLNGIQYVTGCSYSYFPNNNGINVPFGSSYPMIIGQEVYVFPSYHLTMDKNELIKYRRTNGILQREGSLQLPANNSANNLVKLSSTKAYLSLAGLGLIYIFNPETMQKTGLS